MPLVGARGIITLMNPAYWAVPALVFLVVEIGLSGFFFAWFAVAALAEALPCAPTATPCPAR